MSTPTDDVDIERLHRSLGRPMSAAVDELIRTYRLPPARFVSAGINGTVVLEAAGAFPLDEVLAWAGEMVPAPHWWTLRTGTWPAHLELYASGSVGGLVVSIRAETRDTLLPTEPTTDDVLVAASRARWPR